MAFFRVQAGQGGTNYHGGEQYEEEGRSHGINAGEGRRREVVTWPLRHCLGYIASSAGTSWVGAPAAYPFESIQGLACRCDADLAEGAAKASNPIISKAQLKYPRKTIDVAELGAERGERRRREGSIFALAGRPAVGLAAVPFISRSTNAAKGAWCGSGTWSDQ